MEAAAASGQRGVAVGERCKVERRNIAGYIFFKKSSVNLVEGSRLVRLVRSL
jgi:hypothetical protein